METYGTLVDEEASAGFDESSNTPVEQFQSSKTSRENKTRHEFFGHTSQFWVADDEAYTGLHTGDIKHSFIQKVYGILSLQLAVTVLLSTVFMVVDSARRFALVNANVIIWGTMIPTLVCLFALACFKDRYPWNYALLAVFTFAESLTIGVVCAIYSANGAGLIILQAFVITFGVFVALTLFAFQSKFDFTPYSGILVLLLVSMLVVGIFACLFGFSLGIIYSWLGAILFCGFIIVDTQLIMNRMGYDDYIIASIELYLDILNLFLFILQILTGSSRRNRN